jgi:hypothetical protein
MPTPRPQFQHPVPHPPWGTPNLFEPRNGRSEFDPLTPRENPRLATRADPPVKREEAGNREFDCSLELLASELPIEL